MAERAQPPNNHYIVLLGVESIQHHGLWKKNPHLREHRFNAILPDIALYLKRLCDHFGCYET